VRAGVPAQVEAEVVEASVKYRPKRTLVVKLTDSRRDLWIRFLHFYPSQVKQFAPGNRIRLFGEVRSGFFGDEMVHPRYKVVGPGTRRCRSRSRPSIPRPRASRNRRVRAMIESALDTLALEDTLDPALLKKLGLRGFREERAAAASPPARRGRARPRGAHAPGMAPASSSTRSSRSSSRCASPTASAARRRRPGSRRRTRSPTRS
jgi:ATP-dependent DNA helicase RecG